MRSMVVTIVSLFAAVATAKPIKVTYAMPSGWVSAVRFVNPGETYGSTVNLYPKSGSYAFENSHFYSFFTDPLADVIVPGTTYTYVLEVLSVSGPCTFYMGQTDLIKAQLPWTSLEVSEPGVYVLTMTAKPDQPQYDFLDRGMVIGKDGAKVDVSFRVCLFGGTGVTINNYHYVYPGASLNVGIQELARKDISLVGWLDSEGTPITASMTVTNTIDHTLIAQWITKYSDRQCVSVEEVKETGLKMISIATVDAEEPGCDPVISQSGSTKSIVNAVKVPARMIISKEDKVLYDSGEYVKDKSGLTIKVRGNSSAQEMKKSYKLKLQKKADLLQRGDDKYKDKNWVVLNSGNNPYTLIGNKVNELMEMQFVPGCELVNLVVNGDYRGMYVLCESEEVNQNCRINVDKDSGYLFEYDAYWWNEDVAFKTPLTYAVYGYSFKYPDAEDITETQLAYISNCVYRLEQSMDDGTYPEKMDVNSWASWLLAQDILGNTDFAGSNLYLTKYDNTDASKIKMANCWDFDAIMRATNRWSNVHNSDWNHFYFKELLESSNRAFADAYFLKWRLNKDRVQSNLVGYIEELRDSSYCEAMDASVLLDNKRWYNSKKAMSSRLCDALDWFETRFDWIEAQMCEIEQRASRVQIRFDVNGGGCDNVTYVATMGSQIGTVINRYPSEDVNNFSMFSGTLTDNVLHFAVDNRLSLKADYCQAFAKPVVGVAPDTPYTYVMEVMSITGKGTFYMGQTDLVKAQLPWTSQVIDKIGTYVFHMKSNAAQDGYDFLDRLFVIVDAGGHLDVQLRISLFAGESVNADNYRYVEPGKSLAVGFPHPTRIGYAFKGWSCEGNPVAEDSIVDKATDFTLTAIWEPEKTKTTEVPVPYPWFNTYFQSFETASFDYEEKANAIAANGHKVWACYVAGEDPTDEASRFTADIVIGEDGKPVISWKPNLGEERVYKILGSTDLKTWTPVAEGLETDYNFFKVSVEMKND